MVPFPKRLGRFLGLGMVALASVFLAGCAATDPPQTMFSTQGDSARAILNLNNLLFVVAAGVFIIVEGLLVYSVIRYRRRPESMLSVITHPPCAGAGWLIRSWHAAGRA